MKRNSLLILLVCCAMLANAQKFMRLSADVEKYGRQLPNPWAGGLNGPQWSAVDLNNDGKQDLYAFDRNGDVHLTFINEGGVGETKYRFAPEYAAKFPPIKHHVLLRDYNRDGAMDLFGNSLDEGLAGLKVYKGSFDENNQLTFKRLTFPWAFNVLLLEVSGAFTQLPVNATDYPAIDDIDKDGDLDILAPATSGSTVYYFQNMALEKGYSDDTLIYETVETCWGHHYVPAFSESLQLSMDSTCCVFPPCFQPDDPTSEVDERNGVHGGAALCTLDEDNDNDKELLYGDLIYKSVIRGKNCGWIRNAYTCEQDTTYPSYDVSVNMATFPATFYLDVDNDGMKDLLASPNIASGGVDTTCVWFYKNVQNNEYPAFEFRQEDLVQDGMIEFGTGANPAFVDYNADGLMDFVVGNETVHNKASDISRFSRLYLFKNVGTTTQPAFKLEDPDYLAFSQFIDNPQIYAYAPAFGDVDGDGDADLVVGERNGRFFYGENIAGAGNPLAFAPIIPYWLGISVGQYSTPFIHDINKDGLGDLVVGEFRGTVNYLPNIGTVGSPAFHPNPDEAPNNFFFGGINTQQPGWSSGYSAPVVLECTDGTMTLVTGSELGYLEFYRINPDSLDKPGAIFEILDEKLGLLREGRITRPAFADLNGDDFLDALVGNHRGGLGLFRSPVKTDCTVAVNETQRVLEVALYPNPTGGMLFVDIKTETARPINYRIFNALGQFMAQGELLTDQRSIEVGNFANGLYLLELTDGEAGVTKRFVKQ